MTMIDYVYQHFIAHSKIQGQSLEFSRCILYIIIHIFCKHIVKHMN